jgi:hypothetical protein
MVPQSIDPIPKEPHPPPQFLVGVGDMPAYLVTPQLQLYKQGAADAAQTPPCHCVVEIPPLSVSEADPTIDLTVRWFVDYDLSVPRSTNPVRPQETLTGTFNDTTALRRHLSKFDFDADALNLSSGPHVLEVVVGEKDAAFDDSPGVAEPNRTPSPGFALAVYRFFINVKVEQDPARPSCPSEPPSLRVCQ